MSFPYDEQRAISYASDVINTYAEANTRPNLESIIWVTRMQYDAVSIGYDKSIKKQLTGLRFALGLNPSIPVDPPIPPTQEFTEANAWNIIQKVDSENPQYRQVFSTDEEAELMAEVLLTLFQEELMITGYATSRQRNPSGAVSKDKLIIGSDLFGPNVYDLFTLGYAGHATVLHFNREDFEPNPA